MDETITKTLDLKGLSCPLPIAKTAQAIRDLQPGELIESLATDPGAVKDFEAFCRATGNELMESKAEDKVFSFVIKRLS